ncbi:crotonase [candidate division WOR_3 bacterium SM23_60]|uniref:Crotonase n=1 Tax=candidate division WOR_3 bacterium SM23_60 TaxID=1703780 RepID=A0A0S8GE02_UNCW3|nr:MAG: crotonase [candidate division WOR_3 bacterium SM23_60]
MAYKYIVTETDEQLGIVKINRPDVLNAVNIETIRELEDAVRRFSEDDTIAVIIITGEGKSFVSGSDISRLAEMDSLAAREYSRVGQRVLSFIENVEKPVIAAVNGYALGSGCEIAMACDIRVASEKAKFGQPEVKLGLIPGHAGTQRLARLVGLGKAKELIFTGDLIDAHEALRIGLANRVVPPDKLMEAAKAIARKIVDVGPIAVRVAKTVLNRGVDANLTTANSYEMEVFSMLFSTSEAKEGMKAFLEKRKPKWK